MDHATPPNWQQLSDALRRYAQAEYGVDVTAVTFHLSYLGDSRKPLSLPAHAAVPAAQPAQPLPPTQPALPPPWEAWHTESFEVVFWEGVKYEFGPVARKVVKCLWEAWQANRPDVEAGTLLRYAGADTKNLATLLAGNKAWGTLIIKGAGSCYRLAMRCASDPPAEVEPDDDE